MRISGLGVAVALAASIGCGILSADRAHANTINVHPCNALGGILGSVADTSFLGYQGAGATQCAVPTPGSTSSTDATAYDIGGPTEANLATNLNAIAGTSFAAADVTKVNGSGGSQTFDIATLYFSLEIGAGAGLGVETAFFQNNSGGILHLTYTDIGSGTTGGGLSSYSSYGAAVPAPFVGPGLPGLVMACGGLVALARRRRLRMA
jgi:hypothetical protein